MSDSKVAFLNCQFQSCLAIVLEYCSDVLGQVRSIIGCDCNVVHVMRTLVSLDDWVQVLKHENLKKQTQIC